MPKFDRILIANRGEIALRIIRACKEMGIKTVAVYSEADRDSMPVRLADEAICIGPPPSNRSYLDYKQIISAAEICDVDAIHPGYGFLAESAAFAEICRACNIEFIGPQPEQITAMGDKAMARETMRKAGVPITPGSESIVCDEKEAKTIAQKIGYPVIIKASAGGGGRGMRVAHNSASLVQGFHAARAEAEAAFNDNSVYIEKYIENPRHIEFQILADKFGNVIHLGERDCSIQRRHQKLVEESPSPALTPKLRAAMGAYAIKAAKAVNYVNAGTVEFLLGADGSFYFMEMNTRIQVEHPVTEQVTGIDLIKSQIRIASGERLEEKQKDIHANGHCIECRINAENPLKNFAPSPGVITEFVPPGGIGVRLDSHAYAGYRIPPNYDSMIGKLIIHAKNREECITRCLRALEEFRISGVKTTIPFHEYVMSDGNFMKGKFDTGYVDRIYDHFLASADLPR